MRWYALLLLAVAIATGCQFVAGLSDPLNEPDATAPNGPDGAVTDAGADVIDDRGAQPDAPRPVEQLVGGRLYLWDVVADDDAVYFSDTQVYRKSYDGGLQPLATAVNANLALDATHLYFNVGPELRRIPRGGGASELLDTAPTDIQDIAIDRSTIFYNTGSPAHLYARAKAAGPRREIAAGFPDQISASDTFLIATGKLVERDSGTFVDLPRSTDPASPFPIVGNFVAYRDRDLHVVRADLTQLSSTLYAGGLQFPFQPRGGGSGSAGVALDAVNAYVSVSTQDSGAIWALPNDGGVGSPIAATIDPRDIYVTPSRIVWIAAESGPNLYGIFQIRR